MVEAGATRGKSAYRYTKVSLNVLLGVSCFLTYTGSALAQGDPTKNYLTFLANRERTGWIANETLLTPAKIQGGQFGPLWNSPQLDRITIGSTTYTPKMYASPLYIDSVLISSGPFAGSTFSVVIAATSNGFIYAINAFATSGTNPAPAGTILWQTKLSNPEVVPTLDGGVPLGVLGTPIIDVSTSPARIYVASDDAQAGWLVFAVDLASGAVLPGWPVSINNPTLAPINRNGPTTFQPASAMSQRGALNLSPDGRLLYVPFGAYGDGGAGWMVAVDTQAARLASAFAGAPSSVAFANGGMWASAGPAVDANGLVYATTGNGTTANETTPDYWAQSVLQWQSGSPLTLTGTYTPFNYCQMDQYDTDLGGGGPVVLPDLGSANTSTPHLLAFGGKQGNMYLLDRDHMPGSLTVRQGCSTNSTADRSLLSPVGQPQFNGAIGPLNIFGPYSDQYTNLDYAKSRATPAYFQATDGTNYLFATGSTKQAVNSQGTMPPCVTRLKIVISPGKAAYLSKDVIQNSITMLSPGSPLVTSNGSSNAVVWVLAGNVTRSQNLLDPNAPHPVLYALDQNLNILWNSTEDQLNASGKYMIPAMARGTIFVGTDRIQAFGLTAGSGGDGTEIAIDSGGEQAGIFSADIDYMEGHSDTFATPVDTTGVQNPAPEAVYQSKRTGGNYVGFSYVIPGLKPGNTYKLRLHFAESVVTGPGGRVFNVSVNGSLVLPNFDIYQAANGAFRAVIKEFTTTADANGRITITYGYGSAGNPLASGLEIIPVVAIDAGGPAAGTFLADTDFVGGHADTFTNTVDTSSVSNPAPLAVYQSKRTGNGSGQGFTYNIPNLTSGHAYTVRLHFVESAWTAPGQRVFNVAINGNTVLSNFDIFAAAGAAFKANVQTFSVLPSSTGTISIAYQYGSAGNPLASGIEVIP